MPATFILSEGQKLKTKHFLGHSIDMHLVLTSTWSGPMLDNHFDPNTK